MTTVIKKVELFDRKTNTVEYETTDYNKFSLLKNNRTINEAYVAKLEKSMVDKGFLGAPIIVDKQFRIYDGQHRFMAAKNTQTPVRYIVKHNYGMDEIAALNMNGHNWTTATFIESYAKAGLEDYIIFKQIVEDYGISVATLKAIIVKMQKLHLPANESKLVSNSSVNYEVNAGKLRLSIRVREEIIKFLDTIDIFAKFEKFRTPAFINAYLDMYTRPDFCLDHMEKRFEVFGERLVPRNTKHAYLDLLCNEIYSKGKGRKMYFNISRKEFEGI